MDCAVITPQVASQVLHCNPQFIRVVAHREPERLGFPTIVMGSRVKIPRLAFIRFLEAGTEELYQ